MVALVQDALLEAQGRRLQLVLDIHQRFTRIVLAGGGPADIAATLHALLGCPVAVVDASGRLTTVVPSDANSDLDIATTSGVRQPISAGDHEYGEIVAFTDGKPLEDDQLLALERASMAIAVRLAHASAVAEAQERFAAISLEELIAGHPAKRKRIEQLGKAGHDGNSAHGCSSSLGKAVGASGTLPWTGQLQDGIQCSWISRALRRSRSETDSPLTL